MPTPSQLFALPPNVAWIYLHCLFTYKDAQQSGHYSLQDLMVVEVVVTFASKRDRQCGSGQEPGIPGQVMSAANQTSFRLPWSAQLTPIVIAACSGSREGEAPPLNRPTSPEMAPQSGKRSAALIEEWARTPSASRRSFPRFAGIAVFFRTVPFWVIFAPGAALIFVNNSTEKLGGL